MTQGKRQASKAAPRKNSSARTESSNGAQRSSSKQRSARSATAKARTTARRPAPSVQDVASRKIRKATGVAVEAVTDTASEVGDRARRAASATASFVAANALPLTLLGLGAGWLAYTVQQRRRRNAAIMSAARSGEAFPPLEESRLLEQGREKLAALGSRAADAAGHMGDRARQLGHDAIDGLAVAEQRARELAREHPVATSAAAVAAGVGIAMALPDSALENRVLGSVRDKIEDEAKAAFNEVKSGVQTAIETAAEVKNELVAKVAR